MRIAVITGSSEGMKEVALATLQSKEDYARSHCYDFYNVGFVDSSDLGFRRFEVTASLAASYNHVFWIDADSIITNPDIKIEDLASPDSAALIASWDWWQEEGYFSMGNFLLRKAPSLDKLLCAYEKEKPNFLNHGAQEQALLNQLYKVNPQWFCIHPHRVLSAVPDLVRQGKGWLGRPPILYPWQQGDFLAHITGTDNESRLKILRQIKSLHWINTYEKETLEEGLVAPHGGVGSQRN